MHSIKQNILFYTKPLCCNAFMKYLIFLILSMPYLVFAIEVGAERSSHYLPLLKDKRVALVVNQTSRVKGSHIIDYLISKNINITKLFALEHGIRGDYDAGEDVVNGVDVRSGLPVISLYGKNKRPKRNDLQNVDIIIFDIQDIGVRFYTYISSLYYILDACGEFQKRCLIFDRPTPFANQIAGPVLDLKQKSFLGMYPIPVVYGLTMGELAQMIIGEKWIEHIPDFKVITVKQWKRTESYHLPIKPSPNLPNMKSIMWYPTLALFEPTVMSIGRGTKTPFQKIGYPDKKFGEFSFMPKSIEGMSKYPKYENIFCYGEDLRSKKAPLFTLALFYKYFHLYAKNDFIKHVKFFNKLIGNNVDFQKILNGIPYKQIEMSWNADINKYKLLRKKYLIYE